MLNNPKYYFNRELSWLKFNQRVLQESIDETNPLLERLKYIAIASSNMDEFFMIRVSGLKHRVESGLIHTDAAGMDTEEQLKAIASLAKRIVQIQYAYLNNVKQALELEGLVFIHPAELGHKESAWLRHYFDTNIYPVVTPLAVDSGHPFPFLSNKTINTIMRIHNVDRPEEERIAILPMPSVLNRIIEIPHIEGGKRYFVTLEDVIVHFASKFFIGYHIDDYITFRVTRDADLEIDEEETTDLLREVEKSLRLRRRGVVVRLEVDQKSLDRQRKLNEKTSWESLLTMLMENLQIEEDDVYYANGSLDTTMFFSFSAISGYDALRYESYTPARPRDLQDTNGSLFDAIREKDIFIHHPFESFEPVVRFIEQAADDQNVLAIKQTLYRVSSKSPIIAALAKAADNGKQVTVLMEVKARFDEENNIIMARRLEKAGCHVIYGLLGLKTHSKITMVVRRDEDGIRRYVHLATGNYNGSTAKIYTDCGIFTCNDEYGEDASAFFNLISGYSDPPIWNKFSVAPLNLREKIIASIEEEIECVKKGEKGHIIAKMNSLLDQGIIEKLYEASVAGVTVELIIRGICTLRPGIPNVSENITVRSIVGRFLEHHRLIYFRHGGKEDIFLSSADWMPRNLNDRVELLIPIEEIVHKERVKRILNLYLTDNVKAHVMRSDGTYQKLINKSHPVSAQHILCQMAMESNKKSKLTVIERMKPMYKEDM